MHPYYNPPSTSPENIRLPKNVFWKIYGVLQGIYQTSIKFTNRSSHQMCSSKKTEAVVRKCFVKKVFLEILQNSQETTCAKVFSNKVTSLKPATLLKKRIWHRCFPVNFRKFLETPFLYSTSGGCLWKKMFLEISQNSEENTCDRVSVLIKLQTSGMQLY